MIVLWQKMMQVQLIVNGHKKQILAHVVTWSSSVFMVVFKLKRQCFAGNDSNGSKEFGNLCNIRIAYNS